MKALIGITCNYDFRDDVGLVSHMGTEGQEWNFLAADYIRGVEEAGGIPVIIPQCKDAETAVAILDHLDGLLVSGGHDVSPECYGERVKTYCGTLMPMRDAQDIALTRAAMQKKLPVLGICRGIQIMAAAFGGDLYQDIKAELGAEEHFVALLPRNYPSHTVKTADSSLLREILGMEKIEVNSYHHQSVRKVPENGTVTAESEDGIVEAIEFSGGNPFFLGVQWHPEMMFDSALQKKLFRALVNAAENGSR